MITASTNQWKIRSCLKELKFSPTLLINEHVFALRQEGRTVYHMGFGESPFPVHPLIQQSLAKQVAHNAYLPSVGLLELRTLAKHYFCGRLGIEDKNHRAIIGPGSKELIFDIQLAVEGDLLFPVPSWVSYIPQTLITRDNVLKMHLSPENGYKLTGDILEERILQAKDKGRNPRKLILNYPNNPTGQSYAPDELEDIARVARKHSILVISDEIYALVDFDSSHVSISRFYPEGTIITTGLSKHLSLGGFRLGVALIPENLENVFQVMRSIASETFSSVSSPIQYGVLTAFHGSPELEEYISTCTKIHQVACRYVWKQLDMIGIKYPKPSGAFYLYPDFEIFRDTLEKKYSVSTSEELAESLLLERQVATLPGTAFGDKLSNLRLRLSTVDFNGKAALDYAEKFGLGNEDNFIEACCPRIEEGARRVAKYLLD